MNSWIIWLAESIAATIYAAAIIMNVDKYRHTGEKFYIGMATWLLIMGISALTRI